MPRLLTRKEFGQVAVEVYDGHTITRLRNGRNIYADHELQEGQEHTAAYLGISVERMNREHDLIHCMLAHAVGLEQSPALTRITQGQPEEPAHMLEEEAVLAIQRWLAELGVTLVSDGTEVRQ